jgi:23S rRNA pseudouridine2605 synthase
VTATEEPVMTERLNRYLARHGVASRRGADALIEQGRVAVNGAPTRPGTQVDLATDQVTVDGRPVGEPVRLRTLVLNKPVGVVSTRSDPQGHPTVLSLVEDPAGLYPIGRLDTDSRGLLLLTSDGDLAHRVAHPRHGITKRYRATVIPHVRAAALRQVTAGVELEDGPARALEATLAGEDRRGDVVEVVMAEGRRREVRRLFAAVGLRVVDLTRVSVGPVQLGRLKEGQARALTRVEEQALYQAVGLAPPRQR